MCERAAWLIDVLNVLSFASKWKPQNCCTCVKNVLLIFSTAVVFFCVIRSATAPHTCFRRHLLINSYCCCCCCRWIASIKIKSERTGQGTCVMSAAVLIIWWKNTCLAMRYPMKYLLVPSLSLSFAHSSSSTLECF